MKRILACTALISGLLWSGQAEAAAFPDVHPNEKAYEAVEEMALRQLISGFLDGSFRQNEPVTRAQSAIFIGRVHGIEGYKEAELPFTDVAPHQAAFPYIAYYTHNGVFEPGQRFYPDTKLTRAEMARTVVKALSLHGKPASSFSDVPDSHPDASYINALAANGLTSGVGNNKYNPDGLVTRGQMAIFMLNIDNFIGPDQDPEPEYKPIYSIDPNFAVNSTEYEIWKIVNQERAKHGAAPLKLAVDVSFVARTKSKDMHDNEYFNHTSPIFGSPYQMMNSFGLTYTWAGENIAANQWDAEHVMESWMNSPGHRSNILNPSYTEIGIGAYNRYYTQMFLTR
ncbi:S-layer homology domain-containing protein [Bacillus sp. B190/17]|uniref:S-layer homology domain-containing protein n=1 Tax=Bacillus lumedeiriae TaxID=3058829 RepID=A0ABW8IC62_9BACI